MVAYPFAARRIQLTVQGVSKRRNEDRVTRKRLTYRVYASQEIKRGFWFAFGMVLFFIVAGLISFVALSAMGMSLLAALL